MEEPQVVTLPLAMVKPYWRNPRDNRATVSKVKESIELFGYNQYIAIDKRNVIVVGHTRYMALQQLGWKDAKFMVVDLDERAAKAYRIIDNKTQEYSTWTPDLALELRELADVAIMQDFFTEDLQKMLADSTAALEAEMVTNGDVETAALHLGRGGLFHSREKEISCPHCGKPFFIT
jgi:ParB family chromosome partitioning protein